ncbi:MAG: Flp pilus assembly complex ATPase component TadA [Oligoflexia bacterium]|nr:Flp pilus assembly complex ATPase component TadA [Oligoflexia bacterium]
MKVDYMMTNLGAWARLFSETQVSIDELLDTISLVTVESRKEEEVIHVKAEDIGEEIINLVNKVLAEAYLKKVSDIHVEPYEKLFRIRYRLDGNLVTQVTPSRNMMLPIISRLKIMAQMDIAEKRKPQDGRIKLKIGEDTIDYRVSSLPTLFGEKIVLRLLDQKNLQLDMTKLGFEPLQLKNFKDGIHKPYGMCLVTGPTGSGKTTTLYSAIGELNTEDTNVSTAEDPVEFNLEGINQVNVKKDIGYTFAAALKSFLRQDPDVIMVGEIRDLETGEIAVEAALTGHLVLSTLHTNDAPSTITRMLNMGIEPFLITGAMNVVVAQRLCRKICTKCKQREDIKKEFLIACGISPASAEKMQVFKGLGCEACNGTGYKGRVAIYEVLPVTMTIKELILANASAEDIKRQAIKEGMKTLRMSALTKAAMGLTSLEEAISNSSTDS